LVINIQSIHDGRSEKHTVKATTCGKMQGARKWYLWFFTFHCLKFVNGTVKKYKPLETPISVQETNK